MTLTAPNAIHTEHGIPIRNIWHMLLYTWNRAFEVNRWRSEVEHSPTLEALLAKVLCQQVEQRLRIGLGREYVATEQRLRGIRGRVDFNRSLLERSFEKGEAYCRYEAFIADAPRNQIIRSVLARLVRTGNFGANNMGARNLRQRLRNLVRDLDGVTLVEVNLEFIRRQQLGRNDGDYQLMLAICEFLLESSLPTETAGTKSSPHLKRKDLTLHNVFESFVAAFYKHHLQDWTVQTQPTLHWPAEEETTRLPVMKPDLILRPPRSKRVIVLDTKFTARSLQEGQYGGAKYDSQHLYQLYAYLRTQEDATADHRETVGILLYPTVNVPLADSFKIQGHEIRIESVNLAAPWEQVEQELLAITGTCY